ncbi:flagellar motor switch protein FliN [Pseudohoeflea coraliihabitans]|uniref:Flagellar motor switch protein FliN n=1 Tax=Pseudohoeflea coraliihabitans TaxID=2860393 RepID=A0ABS6WN43_9HYPH|nr:flagellar motor switch protein FliN [Pseudohoeflea sp. DP4N28-3]MBW3097381.1 flagellar motor switch protein FliN [Pseudohoeflea sp. DP4N28-3]
MAQENSLDEFTDTAADVSAGAEAPHDQEIDQQVDGLRGVLKKDAGELPIVNDEEAELMGGAEASKSEIGADFAADDGAPDLTGDGGLGGDFPDLGAEPDAFAAGAAGADFGADFADTGATPSDPFDLGDSPEGSSQGGLGGLDDFSAASASTFAAAGSRAGSAPGGATTRMDVILDIPVDVQIILGSSRMSVSALMDLSEGATIALDRKIGEPVEITVNGKLIGRGEITVLEDDETRFGIKMIEVYGTPAKKD